MRSKTVSQKKQVTIIWIIKTPFRVLCKAKDVYIKGMTNFSTTYSRPRMIIQDANRAAPLLPRSFSTTMLSNDHSTNQPSSTDLIRASSTSATQVSMADIERYMLQLQMQNRQVQQLSASRKRVPRSCSVGMVRIDEDRVSSFRDDSLVFKNEVFSDKDSTRLSRNRSCARDSRRF